MTHRSQVLQLLLEEQQCERLGPFLSSHDELQQCRRHGSAQRHVQLRGIRFQVRSSLARDQDQRRALH